MHDERDATQIAIAIAGGMQFRRKFLALFLCAAPAVLATGCMLIPPKKVPAEWVAIERQVDDQERTVAAAKVALAEAKRPFHEEQVVYEMVDPASGSAIAGVPNDPQVVKRIVPARRPTPNEQAMQDEWSLKIQKAEQDLNALKQQCRRVIKDVRQAEFRCRS